MSDSPSEEDPLVDLPVSLNDLARIGRLSYQLEGVGELIMRVPRSRRDSVEELLNSIIRHSSMAYDACHTDQPQPTPQTPDSSAEGATHSPVAPVVSTGSGFNLTPPNVPLPNAALIPLPHPHHIRSPSPGTTPGLLVPSLVVSNGEDALDTSVNSVMPPPAGWGSLSGSMTESMRLLSPNRRKRAAVARARRQSQAEALLQGDLTRKRVPLRWLLALEVMFLVTLYNTHAVPFQVAFELEIPLGTLIWEWIVNAILILDIALKFRSPTWRLHCYALHEESAMTGRKYLHSYRFILDLLTALPLQVFRPICPASAAGALVLNRVLGAATLKHHVHRWMERGVHVGLPESMTKLVWAFAAMLLVIHWIDCLLWVVARASPPHSVEDWLDHEHLAVHERPLLDLYLIGFEFALELLHRTTHGVRPQTDLQTGFTLCLTFLGVGVTATLIAAFEHLARSLDSAKEKFLTKLDTVSDVLRYLKMPEDFQEEVQDYYRHVFKTGVMQMGGDMESIIEDLPEALRRRVNMALTADIVRHVPLFKSCAQDPYLLDALMGKLQPQVFLPSSVVVQQGEQGDTMFFVTSGELRVVNQNDEVLKVFTSGDFFGEVALLNNTVRTATIIANTYCNLFVLSKADFDDLCDTFPEIRDVVMAAAQTRVPSIAPTPNSAPQTPQSPARRAMSLGLLRTAMRRSFSYLQPNSAAASNEDLIGTSPSPDSHLRRSNFLDFSDGNGSQTVPGPPAAARESSVPLREESAVEQQPTVVLSALMAQ